MKKGYPSENGDRKPETEEKSRFKKYLGRIDEAYTNNKKNPRECKKELKIVRESLTKDLMKGKLNEGQYMVLNNKITDYLNEFKR